MKEIHGEKPMTFNSEAFRYELYWERKLQEAISHRHRIKPGRHIQRQTYREWVKHCRKQANLWGKRQNNETLS